MKHSSFLLFCFLLLATMACTWSGRGPAKALTVQEALPVTNPPMNLEHTQWEIKSFFGQPIDTSLKFRTPFVLIFYDQTDGFSATAGCNTVKGRFHLRDEMFSFSTFFATEMQCANMKYEEMLYDVILQAKSYRANKERLQILSEDYVIADLVPLRKQE